MNKKVKILFLKNSSIVIVLYILFVYLIFTIYQKNANNIFKNQATKSNQTIFNQLEREYYQILEETSFIKSLASDFLISGHSDLSSLEKILNQVNKLDKNIHEVLITDTKGKKIIQVFDSIINKSLLTKLNNPEDILNQQLLSELGSLKRKEFYTSEIKINNDNNNITNPLSNYTIFGTPLFNGNKDRFAYLFMVHDFEEFKNIIKSQINEITEQITLIDEFGNIISNHNYDNIFTKNQSVNSNNFFNLYPDADSSHFISDSGYFETHKNLYYFSNFKLNDFTYHIITIKSKKEMIQKLLNNFGVIYLISALFLVGVFVLLWKYSQYAIKRKSFYSLIKKKNAELVERRIERDRFYMMLAHDLRTPFSGILGLTDILSNKIDKLSKSQIIEYSTKINNASVNTLKLLNDLLDWCRTQTNSIKAKPEYFKIKKLIDEAINPFSELIERKKLTIKIESNPSTEVYADRNMIETIIRNLLSNALKFTSSNGVIEITTKEDSDFCILKVKDNGCGIPINKIKTIISASMVNSTIGTNQEKGSGIGLSLCKNFIELNGGTISVKSKVNEGSCFSVKIPMKKQTTTTNE